MELSDRVNKLFSATKKVLSAPATKDKVIDYLSRDDQLKPYIGKDNYRAALDSSVERAFEKYRKDANSAVSRLGAPTGVAASGVDIASGIFGGHFIGADSIGTSATHPIVVAKTLFELPKVYRYLRSAHDLDGLKGFTIYGLRKAAGLLVPWVGPAVEGGALRDMLVGRIRYEAKNDFLRTVGKYESMHDRVKRHVGEVAGPWEDYAHAA